MMVEHQYNLVDMNKQHGYLQPYKYCKVHMVKADKDLLVFQVQLLEEKKRFGINFGV